MFFLLLVGIDAIFHTVAFSVDSGGFGVMHEPLGHRFCFSADEGRTWDVDAQLHVGTDLKDHGYPTTAELAPGSFLSVYYRKDRADERPCLMMTRWQG